MLTRTRQQMFLVASLTNLLGWPTLSGQVAPVPNDPLEVVTSAHVPSDQERAAAVNLLMQAERNKAIGPIYTVKSTFMAYGPVSYTGPGDMEETKVAGPAGRRWTGHLGDFSLTRLLPTASGMSDLGWQGPIPMRIQMVRHTVLAGALGNFGPMAPFRIANASFKGVPVTCLLAFGANNAAPGRDWSEEEYCIDPQSSLLRIASEAPGIYAVYDYSNPLTFHGRTIPGQITVSVAGSVVLEETLSIKDPDPIDPKLWTPTQAMFTNGVSLARPTRRVQSVSSVTSVAGEPVIIHATLGADGHVVEAEALQVSNPLSQSALDLVKNTNYGPAEMAGSSPWQREIYVTVQ
jgi:hypothetical protein